MKKGGGPSRDRDQGRSYKSGSEKQKLKQAENEMLKKHPKITAFLKSDSEEKEQEERQELVEEKSEEATHNGAVVEKDPEER